MNNREINREISADYEKITGSSTLWRLKNEYDRERRKKKIGKEEDYSVFREFKTKSKNPWITRISKLRTVSKYNSPKDSETTSFTYYYSNIGIRVFFRTETGVVSVFNSHLFTRYMERMNLSIITPLDLVKRFFDINREWNYKMMQKEDDEQKMIGIMREGFTPGEIIIEGEELVWFIHKTFISKSAANLRLANTADELIDILKRNIAVNTKSDSELHDDLVKLYRDFGLMENDEFDPEIVKKVREMGKEALNDDSIDTTIFKIL